MGTVERSLVFGSVLGSVLGVEPKKESVLEKGKGDYFGQI